MEVRDLASAIAERMRRRLPDLRHDGSFWRKALRFGAQRGPEPFVRFSPPAFGLAFYVALPSMRRRIAAVLRRTQGRAPTADVARVFMNYASAITETFAASGAESRLKAVVRGDEHFAAARARGKGVIVATAHTSGWYAAGPILGSLYQDDILVVMQRERDARAEDVQAEAREKLGQRVVHVGDDPLAAMPLLAHLRRGGVVALQLDRFPPNARRRSTPFLGETLEIPEGPMRLAGLTGAPIVVVLGRRTGHLSYEIDVSPGIEVPRRATEDQVTAIATRIASLVADFVTRHPLDWFRFD